MTTPMATSKISSSFRLLLGLLLAIAILAVLASRMDGRAVASALRSANPWLLLASFATTLVEHLDEGAALGPRGGRRNGPPPRRRAFAATAIGIAGNLLLPARLGDFARVLVLRRHNPVPAPRALLASWSAQLFDLIAVAAILAGAGLAGHALAPLPALFGVLGAVLALLVFLWGAHRWPRGAERLEATLPAFVRRRLGDTLVNARQGLSFLGHPRTVIAVVGYTVLVWIADSLGMWLGLHAFGIPASPLVAALLVAAIGLSFVLPLTPGNVGTYQVICVLVLGTIGVPDAQAFALGIGFQGFSFGSHGAPGARTVAARRVESGSTPAGAAAGERSRNAARAVECAVECVAECPNRREPDHPEPGGEDRSSSTVKRPSGER